jgi:PPP family 3-phenylpropionic acid transporter
MRRAVTPAALAGFYAAYLGALGVFWPFFGMHLRAVGLSEPEATAVMSIWPGAGLLAPPIIGLVADMFGARGHILRIVTVAAFAGFAIFFVARGLAGLALATAVLALFRSAVLPMVDSLALDARVRYGRIRAWGSLGFLVGALAGGRLIALYNTAAMLVATMAALLPAVFLAFVMPAPRAERQPGAVADWLSLVRRPRLWSLLAATAFAQAGNSIYDAGFSLHLGRLGLGPDFVGLVWAVGVGGEVALMLVSPWIIDRIGAGWLFAAAVTVAAVRWLALATITSPLKLLGLSPLHGVSFGLFYVGAVSLARAEAKDDTRAAVQGLAAAAMAVGGTTGMWFAGRLLHAGGGHAMFGVAAASTAAGALIAIARAVRVRT